MMKNLKRTSFIDQAARLLLPLALVGVCFYLLSFAFDEVTVPVSSTSDQIEGLLTASSALFIDSTESQDHLKGALPQQAMPLANLFALDKQTKAEQVVNAQAISNTNSVELDRTADWFSFDSDYTQSAAWGDVDGDGDLDLAVGNYGEENKLYLNQDGTLETDASWQSEERDNTRSVAWGDVDGDGDLDLAVGNHGPWDENCQCYPLGQSNKVYLNQGKQLEKSASWQSEDKENSHSVAWGDVNGDGKLDLAVGNWVGPIQIYLNQGQELEKKASWQSDRDENVRSVAWGDVDGDGDLDLATANWKAPNKVYLNQGGELEKVASWSSDEADISRSVAWGDVNEDGYLDLAVGNERPAPNRLYLNQGGELEKSASWSSNDTNDSDSVTWGDLNGDGKLDLAVANIYGPNIVYLNLGQALNPQYSWKSEDLDKSSYVALADVDNDGDLDMTVTNRYGSNKLYKNNKKILNSNGKSWAKADITYDVAWGDMDNDGDLDLAVANQNEPNRVYLNHNGKLTTTAVWSDTHADNSESVAWGDMNGDGYLDLAVANWKAPNRIYLNKEGMLEEKEAWSSDDHDESRSVAWGDVDGDGDLDLAVANSPGANKLYLNEGTTLTSDPFWVSEEEDYSQQVAWGDMDNDGDLDLAVANTYGPNKLYQNQDGQLERVASWQSNDKDHTYGIAWGDVNSDGYLDLAVVNNGSPNKVYLNHQGILSRDPFWSSKDSDYSSSVAWGDMDNDGDLDLAIGNRGAPNKVYLNQDGTLTTQAFWASDDEDITRGIAWGDVDGDGDLDLVAGNGHKDEDEKENKPQNNVIYINQRSNSLYPSIALTSVGQTAQGSHETALKLAPADFYALPTIQQSQIISIPYTLFHPKSELMQVHAFYSLNGSGKWLEAKPTAETERTDLDTSPSGVTHTYLWDLSQSAFFGQSDHVVFRLEAQPSFKPIANTVPGPFQHAYVSAQTYPFRVRGSQVRVLSDTLPMSNALVYRLPDKQIRDGKVQGQSAMEPFRTNSAGYLQGRGVLAISDTLVAMLPLENGLHSFDGHNDYVEIESHDGGQIDSLNSLTNSMTVEAVIKPRLLSRDGHIVNRGGGWDESGYSLFLYGKKIRVELQNAQMKEKAIVDTAYPDDHQCHHVAFTWDSLSQEVRTYIDGQLQREIGRFKGPIGIPEQKLNIGRNEKHGRYFNGSITEVRLWNVARSEEELERDKDQRLKGNEAGLVGYWRLNQLADGKTPDRSLQGNDGRGKGQLLSHQETIVNQDPCNPSYTLYYTSPPPSEEESYKVKQLGVQTVTVSADNSLLLFNLDISLEWDASQDEPFMKQLEYDLRRSSELLYDWTDGQAALGELTIYHARQNWDKADIRIYATNRLRPHANTGGIVSDILTDPNNAIIKYQPGHVEIGSSWNRYGNQSGSLGEDWPRALAHELGHYLFFLGDNYLGFDERKHLISIEGCASAMSNPYRSDVDYSEFLPPDKWSGRCLETLSHKTSGRSDWATIETFYPSLKAPISNTINTGPSLLPLEVTHVKFEPSKTATSTLALPLFYLTDDSGGRVLLGSSARAYLLQKERLIDLGQPRLDQVLARGASSGDRLCVFEVSRFGCEEIRAEDDQLTIKLSDWQPDVIVRPSDNGITVEVSNIRLTPEQSISARLYPINDSAPPAITITTTRELNRVTFTFNEQPTAGYVHVQIDDNNPETPPLYETITNVSVHHGSPVAIATGGILAFAPMMSSDGQVVLYDYREEEGQNEESQRSKNKVSSLQSITNMLAMPHGVNPVGPVYRLMTQNVGDKLLDMSITFNYLEQDVLAGEEPSLRIYYLAEGKQSNWQALTTTLDIEYNFASASIQGAGLYALISGQPFKLEAGWNLFAYPLWTTQSITETLVPIKGKYEIVCGYDSEDMQDPWKVYRVGRDPKQNDLQQFEYGHGYWIKMTDPFTFSLRISDTLSLFTNTMIRQTALPAPDECEATPETLPTLNIIYIVQPDDTMYRIAKSHQTTVQAIMEANKLPNAYLEVGQRLIIPGTER